MKGVKIMSKNWQVVTSTGSLVFGPESKVVCKQYLRQALQKGSESGFLSIVHVTRGDAYSLGG